MRDGMPTLARRSPGRTESVDGGSASRAADRKERNSQMAPPKAFRWLRHCSETVRRRSGRPLEGRSAARTVTGSPTSQESAASRRSPRTSLEFAAWPGAADGQSIRPVRSSPMHPIRWVVPKEIYGLPDRPRGPAPGRRSQAEGDPTHGLTPPAGVLGNRAPPVDAVHAWCS